MVLTGSNLVGAASKWDLDYLENSMGLGDFTVFLGQSEQFKFFDEKKLKEIEAVSGAHLKERPRTEYVRPARSTSMRIQEFARRVKEWKTGDERYTLIFEFIDLTSYQCFIIIRYSQNILAGCIFSKP